MIPTQRSVIARLRYKSLDGRWSEVSMCRATRIRVFPRNAVMDRKIFRDERKISSPSTPLINSTEQYSSAIVFLFSYSVKFVGAIFLSREVRASFIHLFQLRLLRWRMMHDPCSITIYFNLWRINKQWSTVIYRVINVQKLLTKRKKKLRGPKLSRYFFNLADQTMMSQVLCHRWNLNSRMILMSFQ